MGKIAVLDQAVAELIAAGEVIERPSSIVKEVLENSIDAGATHIDIEIKNGGKTYIRVTDNGGGISGEDMPVAFLRHATSKIHGEADLQDIATLGFRGEALASICAVAEVEMTSKTPDEEFGNTLRMKAGEQTFFEQTGCPDGTTIIIRNLFYNVPARLKFLKKDASETASVSSVVEKIMLSHPEISFRYIADSVVKLSGGGDGKLENSVYAVFGREFALNVVPVDYTFNGIRITGCITRASAGRATRAMQHFYVNNRFVKSKTCAAALEDGYHGSIMVGKFPGCVLNVDMSYSMVDVNVHPAKIEIRFSDEKAVYEAVYFAVKNTLLRCDALETQINAPIPMTPPPEDTSGAQVEFSERAPVMQDVKAKTDFSPRYRNVFGGERDQPDIPPSKTPLKQAFPEPKEPETIPREEEREYVPEIDDAKESASAPQDEACLHVPADGSAELGGIRFIGELFATYLVLESKEHMILLDKHAAHEKLIYDRLKKQTALGESQMLLVPLAVAMTGKEENAIFSHREQLEKLGFVFDDFGSSTLLIRAVPPILSGGQYDPFAALLEAAEKMEQHRNEITPQVIDEMLHSMACKAAIKAHDISSRDELLRLAREVLSDDTVRHCPHGRPILQFISQKEIERRFGRIV